MLLDGNGYLKRICGKDWDVVCNAVSLGINNGRGLFITGPCGCGKTKLMSTLFGMPNSRNKYWVDCFDQSTNWILDPKENSRIDSLYGYNLFLDDLGTEVKIEYGRRSDFIADFIRMYHARGTGKMFITTNLNGQQMMDLYDDRIISRILEMCVVLKFNGKESKRKVMVANG